jgi:ribosomal protein S12 methylthiotransferase
MEVQAQISAHKLRAKIGTTQQVLVDEVRGTTAIGRTRADAPEIDGLVTVEGARGVEPGDFVQVAITASDEHDLQGKRVSA